MTLTLQSSPANLFQHLYLTCTKGEGEHDPISASLQLQPKPSNI